MHIRLDSPTASSNISTSPIGAVQMAEQAQDTSVAVLSDCHDD